MHMWKGSLNQRKHSGFKKTILKDINVIELLHWIYGAKIVPHLATENGKRLNTFADLCSFVVVHDMLSQYSTNSPIKAVVSVVSQCEW